MINGVESFFELAGLAMEKAIFVVQAALACYR
jgi:hypothetical protein